MQRDRPWKFLFVINPSSGNKSKNIWKDAILNFFKEKPNPVEIFLLNSKNDADCLAKKIRESQPHRVIAVGGDGTVNLIAKTILGTEIVMGILPAGSANGLAKELQLPSSPNEALNIIENGVIEKIDVLHINENVISLHLADIGLNAQLVKYFEESNWRGKFGYAKVMFKTLWRSQRVRVMIETDQGRLTRKAYMVVLANSRTYGTGAVINPEGDMHDGKFEVVIVRKLALSELLKMIFLKKAYDPKKVEVLHTDRVTIQLRRPIYFQSDGEYLGKTDLVMAAMTPQGLNILRANNSALLAE